jgi:hypothetical protein
MAGLKEEFKKVLKAEGFKTITDFINAWVQGGQTFDGLRDWLALTYGIDKDRVTVWKTLRDYLTIPYSYEDQFWYKWDAVARSKKLNDARHMIQVFKKRQLSLDEMAEELGVKGGYGATLLIRRLSQERVNGKVVPRRQYIRHKFKMSRDRDGITQKDRREVWRDKLAKLGFRSLRDAMWRLRQKRGLSYLEIAKIFEISVRDLRYRRRRAGL